MQDSKNQELQKAIVLSEELGSQEFDSARIDAETKELELSYERNPSSDIKLQLLARYLLLTRSLPVVDMGVAIELRERFQQRFPEHFRSFMEILKAQGAQSRWSGCLLCRHNLGHGCSKGLQPRRLPSRYLNRDYACSAFEEKT